VARILQALTDSFRDAGTPARAVSLNERWAAYQAALAPLRGKRLIGLQSGLAGLDAMTLGLRNLTILHAQAGAGKTNLLLQIGLGVLEHEPDAAFVLVSLDMPKDDIIHRLVCNLAQMDWHVYIRGSTDVLSAAATRPGVWHNAYDQERINEAYDRLQAFGKRLFLLERKDLPRGYDANILKCIVAQAKKQAGVRQAFVAVDYLQLLPTPPGIGRRTTPEHDQVELVQNSLEAGDAWWVVSEARKPGKGQEQESGMAAIMGSARIAYACDFAVSYRPLKPEESLAYDWSAARPATWRGHFGPGSLEAAKVAPVALRFDKARDGGTRGELALAFQWTKSRFVEVPQLDAAAAADLKQQLEESVECRQLGRIVEYVRGKPYPEGATSAEIQDLGEGIGRNNAGKLLRKLLEQLRVVRIKNRPGDPPNTKRWWVWLPNPAALAPAAFTDEVQGRLRNGEPIEDVLPGWKT